MQKMQYMHIYMQNYMQYMTGLSIVNYATTISKYSATSEQDLKPYGKSSLEMHTLVFFLGP